MSDWITFQKRKSSLCFDSIPFEHVVITMNERVSAVALENVEHFREHVSINDNGLYIGFKTLARHCEDVRPLLSRLEKEACNYDVDVSTPGNGFRSFLSLYEACFDNCIHLCEAVRAERVRKSFVLYKGKYRRDLDEWNNVLATLRRLMDHIVTLLDWTGQGEDYSLFPSGNHPVEQLTAQVDGIESSSFYGRHGGFQFSRSVSSNQGKMLSALASYSEYYFSNGTHTERMARAFWMGLKYFFSADHRAERIMAITSLSNVDFCKKFWSLPNNSFMKTCVRIVCPWLEVNEVVHIDPVPLQVKLADGKVVNVPPPSAHGPATPIQVRLLSARRRSGMILSSKGPDADVPLSDSLIIHCHGGAFVALNSENYECVMLQWAVCLDVPIISVDYSLAPEFPFPRSLQELLYVYAWALINPQVFGTTAKKIILIGKNIVISGLTCKFNKIFR